MHYVRLIKPNHLGDETKRFPLLNKPMMYLVRVNRIKSITFKDIWFVSFQRINFKSVPLHLGPKYPSLQSQKARKANPSLALQTPFGKHTSSLLTTSHAPT